MVIVGDVLHSRVARSNVALLNTLGAEVVLPRPTLLRSGGRLGRRHDLAHDLDAELPAADAVMMLRVQAERMNGGFFPSTREYSVRYGLSERRQSMLPEHAGGAASRSDAARHGDLILRSGLVAIRCAATGFKRRAVRMAVLFHLWSVRMRR